MIRVLYLLRRCNAAHSRNSSSKLDYSLECLHYSKFYYILQEAYVLFIFDFYHRWSILILTTPTNDERKCGMPLTRETPQIGVAYDKHARYRLCMSEGAVLELSEIYDDCYETVYLRITPETLAEQECFHPLFERIQVRTNKPIYERLLHLENQVKHHYSIETLREQFVYILVADKRNAHATLRPGLSLSPCYRIHTIGGLTEARDWSESAKLGTITSYTRL